MSLLVFAIVVLVLLGLALYAVQLMPLPGSPPIKPWLQVICVVIAIVVLANRAGIGLG